MWRHRSLVGGLAVLFLVTAALTQPPVQPPPGGGFGFGPMQQQRKLLKQFDKDGDGRLNAEERKAAREFLKKERETRGGGFGGPGGFRIIGGPPQPGQVMPPFIADQLRLTPEQKKRVEALQKEVDGDLAKILTEEQRKQLRERRFGPPGGFGGRNREPAKPGPRVSPADVKSYPDASLYEPSVLRTLFLEFEDKDWEAELADFKGTDILVPATLTVDGKKYPNVGVHFRGMSSFMMVQAGHKRSLNLSMDFVDGKQRLYGYKTLNLLNSADDPSFLSTVLYSHIARQHIPTPKVNLVKVVINGESWGVYANAQQFNKEFIQENFKTSKGARWKVRGHPGAAGGLNYIGENIDDYKRHYTIKSKDDEKSWKALIELCRTLDRTPLNKLEEALKPILDIDGVLWFLALDVALQNEDGYWIRASDYSLYRDPKGKFHLIPSDMNEAFQPAMGFGFGPPGGFPGPGGFPPSGGPGGPGAGPRSGIDLDPLVAMNEARKPLRGRLLAVPSLRARYLQYVRAIAQDSLDWKKLGPVVAQYRTLVEKEIEADTRKLYSFDEFKRATGDEVGPAPGPGRRPSLSLRAFAEGRRKFLLEHPEIKKVVP